jgi:hypothetical protein
VGRFFVDDSLIVPDESQQKTGRQSNLPTTRSLRLKTISILHKANNKKQAVRVTSNDPFPKS